MNSMDITNSLYLSAYHTGKFNHKFISDEKVQSVKKSGCLQYIKTEDADESDIGGLENLKEFLEYEQFTPSEKYNLPNPNGIIIVGPAGTGKSLTAKCVGSKLELPTLRLAIQDQKTKYVGESNQNLQKAIKMAEAMAPCVIWIDEIDKALGHDTSGVNKELLGTLLTWMQEKKKLVYVVATANEVTGLDSALLRKGRFDEIFFVDLPSTDERKEIFNIHIRKKNFDPKLFDIAKLVKQTNGYTGAEIEAVLIAAGKRAVKEERDVCTQDVEKQIEDTKPINEVRPEAIKAIRDWCKGHVRNASKPEVVSNGKKGVRKIK